MYIEVFLLDNLLMNAVICVLAGAVCGRSIRLGRVLLFSLGSAVYGAAAMYVPVLSMFPCKTILCLAMALVFPYEGLRGYITGLTAILAAALTIGGLGFLMICAFGNVRSLGDGISLRLMLLIAFAASIMPGIARRVRGKRLDNQNRHTLLLKRGDKEYELDAMVDSGNCLRDYLTHRPGSRSMAARDGRYTYTSWHGERKKRAVRIQAGQRTAGRQRYGYTCGSVKKADQGRAHTARGALR